MAGHIRKRSKDSWTVVVDLGTDPSTGKRRQAWRSLKGNRRDAESLLVQLLHQRDMGIDQPPGKTSVEDYLIRWLDDYAKINTAPRTFERYEGIVRNHLVPAFGSIPLTKLRPRHIQQYYRVALTPDPTGTKRTLSRQSVLHHHRVLRHALSQAVRLQLLGRNPADAVQPPKVERREQPVPDQDAIERLIAAAESTPYQLMISLAVMTGMRQGELLGLRWRDLDRDKTTLSVNQTLQWINKAGITFRPPKTHRSRRPIALPKEMASLLNRHRQRQLEKRVGLGPVYDDHDLVFCREDGRPIDPSNFRRTWRGIVKRSGVVGHVRFHDLRHAHATQLLMAGVHPKIVSERLGHATVSITLDTYSHVVPGLQAEAVEKLGEWQRAGKAR